MQFTLRFDPAHDLRHARERVAEDDAGKWDRLVPRRQIAYWSGHLVLPATNTAFTGLPPYLTPTPWATGQLCRRLGIPTVYYRRCPSELRDAQLAHWLQVGGILQAGDIEAQNVREENSQKERSKPETWLLRGKGATLRGLLSERYSPLDNAVLLDSLAPVLDEQFQVSGFSLTDESLHLRIIHPLYAKDIRPNDRLVVGLHLTNSEVGCRAVTIDALVFRLVCENGLVSLVKGKSLLYRRHVGIGDPAAFQHQLGQAVSHALVNGASFLEKLSWTTRTYLPRMDEVIAALGEQWSLSQWVQERITANLLAEPAADQDLVWCLINAVTLAAQSLSPDARYDLEVKAGLLAEHGFAKLGTKDSGASRYRLAHPAAPEPLRSLSNGSDSGNSSSSGNGFGLPASAQTEVVHDYN